MPLGMTREELRLWTTGVVVRVVRAWAARVTHTRPAQPPSRIRPGEFICDNHWVEIERSWSGPRPISPTSVTTGLTVGLYLAGEEPRPVRHACCKVDRHTWQGILARSRPPLSESPGRTA